MTSLTLLDIYLRPATTILCLATYSKLGLTQLVSQLQARATVSQAKIGEIIDGGFIGLPVIDYMPYEMTAAMPPTRIILLHHPQDTPRLLDHYAQALSLYFGHVPCLFHNRDHDLDLIIST